MNKFGNRILLGKYSFPNVFCTPFVKEVYKFMKLWGFHAQEECDAEANFEVMVEPHEDTVIVDMEVSCAWDCGTHLGRVEALIIGPGHLDLLNEQCTALITSLGHHRIQCPNAPFPPANLP
jgi:hypothetical protein